MDPLLTPAQFETVLLALQRGAKIEAVKLYREATGLGLAESKDAVERIEAARQMGESPTGPISPYDRARILAVMGSMSKVEAIKELMEMTGLGLAVCKNAVETIAAEENIVFPVFQIKFEAQKGTQGARITPTPPPTGLTMEKRMAVMAALSRGNKIEAIKIYREATGAGLAESKAAVEAMAPAGAGAGSDSSFENRTPLPHWDPFAEKKKGCFGMIAVLLGMILGVMVFG